jgi:hypothetical protein
MSMNCRGCGTPQERCTADGRCCAPCNTNKTLHHTWGSRVTKPAVMTPERLAEIREHGSWNLTVRELLAYVDELTTQRDDARRIAIDSGVFQNYQGTWYPEPGPKFTADPVGPVAWDKQVQQ